MEELKQQLLELNDLADRLYGYVEAGRVRLTRRRILIIQSLLYIDKNTNAVVHLLDHDTPYTDGAQMIMRSMYDLSTNVDWVLRARTNERLWRWLRDDRKTLHRNLKSMVSIRIANPNLRSKGIPLTTLHNMLSKVDKELVDTAKRAGSSTADKELSLYSKVKGTSLKAQLLYHMMFWLFSTRTHASATGLQNLMTLNPIYLKRRTDTTNDSDDATKLTKTSLLWYSSHLYRDARYLKTPFVDVAKALYDSQLTREER